MNTNNINNHTIFFTIFKDWDKIEFTSDNYNFIISEENQQPGTNGKALWYYRFNRLALGYPNKDLEWVSWNKNPEKGWEYLLLVVNDQLYSGFLNQSKEQFNKYYCKLAVVSENKAKDL